jgi:nicotinamidase-related amidase
MSKPPLTLQAPPSPDPVPVGLNPATTALLVFDVVDPICARFPICKTHMAPVIAALLARARNAGVTVAYGTRAHHKSHWLPEVAPQPGDIQIENQAQDRFYNTDLDKALKAKGIKTLIMVGWKISGSVTYTSVGAMARDYTVVIPMDTTSAGSGYETTIGLYNVLNSGNANLANEPLKPKAVTLTRTDLITFR